MNKHNVELLNEVTTLICRIIDKATYSPVGKGIIPSISSDEVADEDKELFTMSLCFSVLERKLREKFEI